MKKLLLAVFSLLVFALVQPSTGLAVEDCPLKFVVAESGELCLNARTVRRAEIRANHRMSSPIPSGKVLTLKLRSKPKKQLSRLLARNVGKVLLMKYRDAVVSAHTIREPVLGAEFRVLLRFGTLEETILWHIRNWR